MKFIRKGGRVIPIKDGSSSQGMSKTKKAAIVGGSAIVAGNVSAHVGTNKFLSGVNKAALVGRGNHGYSHAIAHARSGAKMAGAGALAAGAGVVTLGAAGVSAGIKKAKSYGKNK